MVRIVRIVDGMAEMPSPEHIGAKAANIAHIARLGIPVPPAFVIPIELCMRVIQGDADTDRVLRDALEEGIGFLEETTALKFGGNRAPLLVSVRSGAARSMPGMLDTVLDVGCCIAATRGLIRRTGNPRFAWDCRRRFIESYCETVSGMDRAALQRVRLAFLRTEQADFERDIDCEAMERLAGALERLADDGDVEIPESPFKQLHEAARAVYRSWISDRAVTYRRLSGLDDLAGTAVMVQAMVFGNRGRMSGSGVAFSRDPSKGARDPVIEVLIDAQGEDVVSGRLTPDGEEAIEHLDGRLAIQLREILSRLEREFADVQDIEFTIEDGKLWILQTRNAKRTPMAELRFAVDLVKEGLISRETALSRLASINLDALKTTRFDNAGDAVAQGVGAGAGVASGRIAFDSAGAKRLSADGAPVILVRPDVSTADVAGFASSCGILTAAGGRTSHAALVARQLGIVCVVGCATLAMEPGITRARLGKVFVEEGDWLSIDGNGGDVYLGRHNIISVRPDEDLQEVESWRHLRAAV